MSAASETKTAIRPSELNQKILDDIHQKYPDYMIVEAFKVNNRGIISYEAIIQQKNERINLYYSSDGLFERKENPLLGKNIQQKVPIKR